MRHLWTRPKTAGHHAKLPTQGKIHFTGYKNKANTLIETKREYYIVNYIYTNFNINSLQLFLNKKKDKNQGTIERY